MKLILSPPAPNRAFTIEQTKGLLLSYWAWHGVRLEPHRVRVAYNEFHGFWDVHVGRGPFFKSGRGTLEYQKERWADAKAKLLELHPDGEFYYDGWDWVTIEPEHLVTENVSRQDPERPSQSCPAIRLWLPVQERGQ